MIHSMIDCRTGYGGRNGKGYSGMEGVMEVGMEEVMESKAVLVERIEDDIEEKI